MPSADHEAKWSHALRTFVERLETLKPHERIADEYSGEKGFQNFVLTEPATCWDDFLQWVNALEGGSWCFRGQREAVWSLTTSLDRAVFRHKVSENSASSYHLNRRLEELDLLFRFQQQAHQYLTHLPHSDDRASWLALMQHYGVPTRFLDWTMSPYVGMYFALEEEPVREEKRSSLWAIDLAWLKKKAEQLVVSPFGKMASLTPISWANTVNELLQGFTKEQSVILPVNPYIGNDRLSSQQGLLLCKLFHEAPFYGLLMSMIINPNLTERPVVRKLEIRTENRIEFLRKLRTMNLHRLSLFPGLDGFGRLLKLDLELKDNG